MTLAEQAIARAVEAHYDVLKLQKLLEFDENDTTYDHRLVQLLYNKVVGKDGLLSGYPILINEFTKVLKVGEGIRHYNDSLLKDGVDIGHSIVNGTDVYIDIVLETGEALYVSVPFGFSEPTLSVGGVRIGYVSISSEWDIVGNVHYEPYVDIKNYFTNSLRNEVFANVAARHAHDQLLNTTSDVSFSTVNGRDIAADGNILDVLADSSSGISKVAGENIPAASVCVVDNDKVYLADKDNMAHVGKNKYLVMSNVTVDSVASMQSEGVPEYAGWGLTTDVPLFLGSGGAIVDIVPTTGFIQQVGVAITADKLDIEIGMAIKL